MENPVVCRSVNNPCYTVRFHNQKQRMVFLENREESCILTEGTGDIVLSLENKEPDFGLVMMPTDRQEHAYWQGRLIQYALKLDRENNRLREFDRLLFFDRQQEDENAEYDKEELVEILSYLSMDMNQLTIITKASFLYEKMLENLYYTTGLAGTCMEALPRSCTESEEGKPYYLRQKVINKKMLVIWTGGTGKVPLWGIPKESLLIDLTPEGKAQREIQKRRQDIESVSMGNFLDTIVKNRYNTLVKEGKLKQNTVWEHRTGKNKKLCNNRKEKQGWKKRKTL